MDHEKGSHVCVLHIQSIKLQANVISFEAVFV